MLTADSGGFSSRPKKAVTSAPASPLSTSNRNTTQKKYSSSNGGSLRAAERHMEEKKAAADQRARAYADSQRPQTRPTAKPSGTSVRAAERQMEEKKAAANRRAKVYADSQRPQSRPATRPSESLRAAERRIEEKRTASSKTPSSYPSAPQTAYLNHLTIAAQKANLTTSPTYIGQDTNDKEEQNPAQAQTRPNIKQAIGKEDIQVYAVAFVTDLSMIFYFVIANISSNHDL